MEKSRYQKIQQALAHDICTHEDIPHIHKAQTDDLLREASEKAQKGDVINAALLSRAELRRTGDNVVVLDAITKIMEEASQKEGEKYQQLAATLNGRRGFWHWLLGQPRAAAYEVDSIRSSHRAEVWKKLQVNIYPPSPNAHTISTPRPDIVFL